MKKYTVWGSERVFYSEAEIEAKDETEARLKYDEMIASGIVRADDSQGYEVTCNETK